MVLVFTTFSSTVVGTRQQDPLFVLPVTVLVPVRAIVVGGFFWFFLTCLPKRVFVQAEKTRLF